jgi:S1-C subfamily serine protease
VITSVNGGTISSANGLANGTASSHPGDQFAITYVDQYGMPARARSVRFVPTAPRSGP